MTISDLSIKNPVFAWMLMFGLMLFGWVGYSRMGVSQMPDVDFPVVNITVTWDGAAPEIMEAEVVDVIEDAVTSVQGVKQISSSSKLGQAAITVELELDRPVDFALQEIQTKIAQAQQRLPRDIDPPIVMKVNPEDQPIMWLAVSGDDVPVKDLMVYTQDVLKNKFQTVPGVGDIFLGGLINRNLRVWLDAEKMAAEQITVEDVLAAIRREHAEVPAGQIETPTKEFNVRTLGEFSDPAKFGELLITQRGGQAIHVPIPLKRVARIEDGLADQRRISRVNGSRAVGIGIRKQRGANAVEIADRVKKRMEEIKPGLPKGMKLGVNFDSTQFIKQSVAELTHHLILAAVLTSLVCWLFLGSWSSTLNVLLAIPTSVLGTFIVTYFLGFTLNSFTLLGLTLSIGIVVDDAIMVLENIVRHHELGKNRLDASVFGAREIAFAALAATLAILAIFLPVVFMKGIIGKFFFQFGVTISAAVSFSLLEALTLAPMRTSQFLETATHGNRIIQAVDRTFASLTERYRRGLAWTLDRRWKTVGAAALFFALSMISVKYIRKEFVPAQDQSMFMMRLETPVGSSMEFTDAKFKEVEAWLLKQPALDRYYAAVGGFGGGEVNAGMMFLTMKPISERPLGPDGKKITQGTMMAAARKDLNAIPSMRAFIMDLSQGGFSSSRGFPIEFTVRGPNWDILTKSAVELKEKLEKSGSVVDVDTDYKTGLPEIRVHPNRQKAYARGVSIQSIGTTINAMIGGVRSGLFTDNGRRYDVRVRAETGDRLSADAIRRLYVRNQRGEMIRMSDVVDIDEEPTLLAITRKDRERAIGVFANVAPGKSQAQVLADVEKLAKETLPDGYHVVLSGSSQTFKESFQSLLFALVLGILVAYMVLGSQFNSFVHPFTVLLALPFSMSGAFLTLLAFDRSLNINSMIGLLLLMGLVKKNSIMLVDFTNQRREEGLEPRAALLDACPVRLRPILMTSVATIAAAVPTALSRGAGSETTVPMALSLIGGVSVSTLLTLFVVPAAYSLLVRVESGRATETTAAVMRAVREAERLKDEKFGAAAR
ncbi:MAG: efflux RND transporter permease subunit [Elusimicrobiota bacterium]|nr:MAG: efflux RND transporter permease subunit [Elusimicrobiota bacterium]